MKMVDAQRVDDEIEKQRVELMNLELMIKQVKDNLYGIQQLMRSTSVEGVPNE